MMDQSHLKKLIGQLKAKGISFAVGLSDSEISEIEGRYGFKFPPDLKAFLQYALPVSDGFVNWREDSEEVIRGKLAWPLDGICFDIEHNDFWMRTWGPKPPKLEESLAIARRAVTEAPFLIPIYAHRYLPAEPAQPGNPVFSVHQTDIILYGFDLASYLSYEFKTPLARWAARIPRPIRFWDEVIETW